jgi:hypothetical protein
VDGRIKSGHDDFQGSGVSSAPFHAAVRPGNEMMMGWLLPSPRHPGYPFGKANYYLCGTHFRHYGNSPCSTPRSSTS